MKQQLVDFITQWFINHPSTIVVDETDGDYSSFNADTILVTKEPFELEFPVYTENGGVVAMSEKGLLLLSFPSYYEEELTYEEVDIDQLIMIKDILTSLK